MRILGKSGLDVLLLARPEDKVQRGDYLLVEEGGPSALILQVYEEDYLESPSISDEIVREELVASLGDGLAHDPHEIGYIAKLVRDLRIYKCKIRGRFRSDLQCVEQDAGWLPSRASSTIRRITFSELMKGKVGLVEVGTIKDGDPFTISVHDLDGCLNLILGRKGTGKSHLAKILMRALVERGARLLILDINDEYGRALPSGEKLIRLEPGKNLRMSLDYLGLSTLCRVLSKTLELPGASLREFVRIWHYLASEGEVNLKSLGDAIRTWHCNERVRDALFERYYTLMSSHLFTYEGEEGWRVEEAVASLPSGGAIVISLKWLSSLTRRVLVDVLLGKLAELLEEGALTPIFLIAEEAQLYVHETYWDDLITRMRHLGLFTTFITNEPDSLERGIYRQADNIFLFNLTSDEDLRLITSASALDEDTLRSLAPSLPPGWCLVMGKVVGGLPVVVRVKEMEVEETGGEGRLFFGTLKAHV